MMDRIGEVDAIRGIAVVLMIIYHFFFDVWYLGLSAIDLMSIEWILFQRIIGTLFLLVAGISIVLSEKMHNSYNRHLKRAMFLGIVALTISAVTWIFPHEGFIKFGIIHLIALSTAIAPFFFTFGKWKLVIGLVIIAFGLQVHYTEVDYLFFLGLVSFDYVALDHYPLVPWFGVILIGMFIGENFEFKNRKSLLEKIGRNSLLIYLVHQPLFISLLLAF